MIYNILCDLYKVWKNWNDKREIYNWLKKNTGGNTGYTFRSAQAIASATNLTESRVAELCSIHKKIRQSVGERSDSWCIR